MKAIIILFILPLKIFAQDITGLWTGTLYNDTTKNYIPYEIAISEGKGRLIGYSHTTWKPDKIDDVVNIGVKELKIKRKKDKLYIEDEKWLYNNYPAPPPKGVRQYSLLSIQTDDSGIILSGPFNTNPTKEYASATGTIRLQKKDNYKQTKLIPKLDELNLLKTLSFLPPTITDTEVIAAVNPPQEKPKLIMQSEISSVEKSSDPDLPKSKETITVPIVSAQKAEKNILVTPPQKKEVAVVSSPKPVIKTPAIARPKEKEVVVVSVPKPIAKTSVTVAKQKEVVKVPPPAPEIKIPVVVPKQKDVVLQPTVKPAIKAASIIVPVSAADLASRKIETIRSVNVKTDSLVLILYDNGEVDGDTVSVILNGKTVMSRQGLTANAITKTIYLTPDLGDSMQLIMYAENLGSIPPNTGLLILQDGDDRYEIRFAGDMQKNSAIILRRRH